jgi:hypothetical protein
MANVGLGTGAIHLREQQSPSPFGFFCCPAERNLLKISKEKAPTFGRGSSHWGIGNNLKMENPL